MNKNSKILIGITAILFLSLPLLNIVYAVDSGIEQQASLKTWIIDGKIAFAKFEKLGRILIVDGEIIVPNGDLHEGIFIILWRNGNRHVMRLEESEFKWSMNHCELSIDRPKRTLYIEWETKSPTQDIYREFGENMKITIDGQGRSARVKGLVEIVEQNKSVPLCGRGLVLHGTIIIEAIPVLEEV
jgi:hypothetical protein